MVELSKSIANKIKEKQGDITEDEVNQIFFKSTKNIPMQSKKLSA